MCVYYLDEADCSVHDTELIFLLSSVCIINSFWTKGWQCMGESVNWCDMF
jgi:hypothetical protein